MFTPLGMLSPKIITLCFFDVKGPLSWSEVGFLREVGIGYVVTVVVSEDLVEVDVASDTDDLVAGVTAAVVVVVAFAVVVFDDD